MSEYAKPYIRTHLDLYADGLKKWVDSVAINHKKTLKDVRMGANRPTLSALGLDYLTKLDLTPEEIDKRVTFQLETHPEKRIQSDLQRLKAIRQELGPTVEPVVIVDLQAKGEIAA